MTKKKSPAAVKATFKPPKVALKAPAEAAPPVAVMEPDTRSFAELQARVRELEEIAQVLAQFAPLYTQHPAAYKLLDFRGMKLTVADLRCAAALLRAK